MVLRGCDCENSSCSHRAGACTGLRAFEIQAWGFKVNLCEECLKIWRVTAHGDIESVERIVDL